MDLTNHSMLNFLKYSAIYRCNKSRPSQFLQLPTRPQLLRLELTYLPYRTCASRVMPLAHQCFTTTKQSIKIIVTL